MISILNNSVIIYNTNQKENISYLNIIIMIPNGLRVKHKNHRSWCSILNSPSQHQPLNPSWTAMLRKRFARSGFISNVCLVLLTRTTLKFQFMLLYFLFHHFYVYICNLFFFVFYELHTASERRVGSL